MEAQFIAFEEQLTEALTRENIPSDRQRVERSIDMCYAGQWRVLQVPITSDLTRGTLSDAVRGFHKLHDRRFSFELQDREVEAKCRLAVERNMTYKDQLKQHTVLNGQVSITDFRPLGDSPEGNRFLVYSLFPEAVVSVKIRHAEGDLHKVRVSVGHSIFNRTCPVHVGELMAKFGGGGHEGAGSTPLVASAANILIEQLIEDLQETTPKGAA